MKITVYADTHFLAPHEMSWLQEQIFNPNPEILTMLLGDIVDRDNCKRKEVHIATGMINKLRSVYGENYLLGNHEIEKDKNGYFQKRLIKGTPVLFCHGHNLFWSDKKIKKWENKKWKGMSWWRYKIYRMRHHFKEGKPLNLSNDEKIKLVTLAETYGCKAIVFGHTHRYLDIKVSGIRIIALQRGKTEIMF